MILHGKYNKGKIEFLEKELPDIESDIEVRFINKPWQRDIKSVPIKGEPMSETIIKGRYEDDDIC